MNKKNLKNIKCKEKFTEQPYCAYNMTFEPDYKCCLTSGNDTLCLDIINNPMICTNYDHNQQSICYKDGIPYNALIRDSFCEVNRKQIGSNCVNSNMQHQSIPLCKDNGIWLGDNKCALLTDQIPKDKKPSNSIFNNYYIIGGIVSVVLLILLILAMTME